MAKLVTESSYTLTLNDAELRALRGMLGDANAYDTSGKVSITYNLFELIDNELNGENR